MTKNILLIHGLDLELNQGPHSFDAMMAQMLENNINAYAPQLPSNENIRNAQFIADYVRDLNLNDYVLLGYSLGGLSTRLYIKHFAGIKPYRYISLDAPQHGAAIGCFQDYDKGGEACGWSSFISLINYAPEALIPTLCIVNHNPTGMGDSGKLNGAVVYNVNLDHGSLPQDSNVISSVIGYM